jgi:hypothetical protein
MEPLTIFCVSEYTKNLFRQKIAGIFFASFLKLKIDFGLGWTHQQIVGLSIDSSWNFMCK